MSAEMKANECSNKVHNYGATRYSIQLFQWLASTLATWLDCDSHTMLQLISHCVYGGRTYVKITDGLQHCFTWHSHVCCLSTLQYAFNSLVCPMTHPCWSRCLQHSIQTTTTGSTASTETKHEALVCKVVLSTATPTLLVLLYTLNLGQQVPQWVLLHQFCKHTSVN